MDTKELERIAALIGEPARAKILWSLLDGKAYTATELSHFSDTSAQSASMHLSKLVQASLLKVSVQGRHRYYSFSRDEVAYAIEALAGLTAKPQTRLQVSDSDYTIRHCRTCYDHLAGTAGVAIHDRLIERNYLFPEHEKYSVTDAGKKWFNGLGIDTPLLVQQRRVFARPCLDWSERRYHLAGSLGAAFLDFLLSGDYMRRVKNSRAVIITSIGQGYLYDILKIDL
jgi:DNA-binding transcriptional ArsR family regulator